MFFSQTLLCIILLMNFNCKIFLVKFDSHYINLLGKCFDKHNIKLRKDKCQFFTKEIEYLGHILGHNTVKPSEKNQIN
jgi:hypothetical protein